MKELRMGLIGLLILVNMLYGLTWAEKTADGSGPVLSWEEEMLEISVRDHAAALLSGVTAWDAQDGDLSQSIYVQGVSKLRPDDTAVITYLVFDSHGNMASGERILRYRDYHRPRFSVEAPLIYKEGDLSWLSGVRAVDMLDGDITDAIHISTLAPTDDPEISLVSLWVTNSRGDTGYLTLPVMQDQAGQKAVALKRYLVYLDAGAAFDSRAYLEDPDGVTASGTVDTNTPGTYLVTYRDRAGQACAVLTVVVV